MRGVIVGIVVLVFLCAGSHSVAVAAESPKQHANAQLIRSSGGATLTFADSRAFLTGCVPEKLFQLGSEPSLVGRVDLDRDGTSEFVVRCQDEDFVQRWHVHIFRFRAAQLEEVPVYNPDGNETGIIAVGPVVVDPKQKRLVVKEGLAPVQSRDDTIFYATVSYFEWLPDVRRLVRVGERLVPNDKDLSSAQ